MQRKEIEKVNNFLSELRKSKSNEDIDKLVKNNVNFVNGLSDRFRKDVENNVRAWRKTVDG